MGSQGLGTEPATHTLEVILGAVADGITAQAADGQLIYANEAAVRAIGFESAEELLRTPPEEIMDRFELLDADGRPYDLDNLPGRRALAGEEATDVVRFRVRATGEERWVIVKARPVRDEDGSVALAINVLEDVTEQKAAEQAQRFLADVATALVESLDYETTLRTVAELAVPAVADRAAVDVAVPDDPERAEAVRHVLDTGEPRLSPTLIVAPLVARGRTVAALSLARSDPARPYEAADLEMALEVGRRAGLALDNARLFSDRAYTARALQESLLPPVIPEIPGFEVASRYRAAGSSVEVGGDFYDLFEVGGGGWALVIGDVCGKGPDAAAVTALARYTLRAGAMQRSYPSHILSLLNDALLRQRTNADFCTVALGRLDVHEGGAILMLATGGHPLPLLLTANGEVRSVGKPGTLLGVIDDPTLRDDAVELSSGDVLVFYTDGVTEAGAPQSILGTDALRELVASSRGLSPAVLAERIELAAVEATGGGALRDDMAILVARVR
jgi:PAS domain S-box-containing protein